jgi:nitroreductase
MSADDLERIIHSRISAMTIDRDKPVAEEIIHRLVQAAQAAPNHRKTRPLRIAVLQEDARLRYGEAVADAMQTHGDDQIKVDKTRTKYGRAPVVLVVASALGASELETEENRYAVAAGIQNMLLLLEELGMTALWSTPAKGTHHTMTQFCQFDDTDHVVGIIYLGWGTREGVAKERPAPIVRWLS